MSKQRLDQLYCTHCTFRTSALHRREGASGDQVFEETARAGSIPREKSHDVYSRFGSNLLFHVPGDMPAEKMITHTAHTLPLRRMVYLPSVGGYRLLGQVCFRQKDTRGRPGASFSHVVIQDLKEFPTPWSVLDCLRLWGSKKWVIEDRPDLQQDLPHFGDLKEFDPGFKPPINDQLLTSFLTTSRGEQFQDPEEIIPKRWQQTTPEARQKLLVYLLQATLNLDIDRRESLFIAVEPSVAALLFYGIYRLLPAVGIGEKLSFSTYQSHRDRLMTTLAATCFHDPIATDLPSDWYSPHARGAAYNTFKPDRHTPLKKNGQFAAGMVARFLSEDGPSAVDDFLADCRRLGLGTPEELEGLSAIEGQVTELLKSQTKEQLSHLERTLPRAPGLRALLREKLVESIHLDSESAQLLRLLAHPSHALLILRLLTETGTAENTSKLEPTIQVLISRWPETAAAELLNEKDVAKKLKVDFVCRFVEAEGTLPGDAEALFFAPGSTSRRDNLLEDVLRRLHGTRLKKFVLSTFDGNPTESRFCELLRKLAPLATSPDHDQAFTDLFRRLTTQVADNDERKQILHAAISDKVLRDKFKTWFEDETIADHLLGMLNTLEKSPRQLDNQLTLLEELKHFIPQCKVRINSWRTVTTQLNELQRLNSQPVTFVQKMLGQGFELEKDKAAQELAFAAKKAFPVPQYGYTDADATKVTRLLVDVLGNTGLPEDFQSRCENVFAKDVWARRGPGDRTRKKAVITPGRVVATVMMALLAILAFRLVEWWRTSEPNQVAAETKKGKAIESDAVESVETTKAAKKTTEVAKTKAKPAIDAKPVPAKAAQQVKVEKEAEKPVEIASADNKKPVATENPATIKPETAMVKPEPAAIPETDVTWPSFFELPQLEHAGPQQETTLQSWKSLKDLRVELLGIKEINTYLAKSADLKLKEMRLYIARKKMGEGENVPTIRVYKVTHDVYVSQQAEPNPALPQERDLLCWFAIRKDGLFFDWENLHGSTREHKFLQEMLRLCCLHVESHKYRGDINLLAPKKVFTEKGPTAVYTYDKNSKRHGAALEFESHLKGMRAFEWLVVRGRINERIAIDKPPNEFSLDTSTLTGDEELPLTLNDSVLAKNFVETKFYIKFVCDTVRFDQEFIQDPEGNSKLKVIISPDFSDEKLNQRLKTLARIKTDLRDPLA
ncbi:MAG: hypothetical protein JWM11_3186, partial [Planctomycetaceae bacterium]|nr:hypothetical protein [Planctomycetaceae bacterium]